MNRALVIRQAAAAWLGCAMLSAGLLAQTAPGTSPAATTKPSPANKQVILGQARQAYYNLRSEGLQTFQCTVTPNWEQLLEAQRKQDPDGADAAMKTLQQIRFTLLLAADGNVSLTHNDLPDQSEQMKDALSQIYGGMEQMTSGFFDTWKLFMVSSPFPEVSSDYQLDDLGPRYRLAYKEGTASIATTMGRDFAISTLVVTTPEFDSTIQPSFVKNTKGFVLSGYDATYRSQKAEESTQLKVLIDYLPVQGLQMLRKLNLSGAYGGNPFSIELGFSDCQVTKKQ